MNGLFAIQTAFDSPILEPRYYFGIELLATNDAAISSKLTAMAKEGWKLVFDNSAVESNTGDIDDVGVLITRYVFYKD